MNGETALEKQSTLQDTRHDGQCQRPEVIEINPDRSCGQHLRLLRATKGACTPVVSGLSPLYDVEITARPWPERICGLSFTDAIGTRPSASRVGGAASRRRRASSAMRDQKWWSQTGSNRRHPACKAGALPAELWPRTRRDGGASELPGAPQRRLQWWAWEDLNFRPHAYQARALTN